MQIQLNFRDRSWNCKCFLCSFRKAVKLERQIINIYGGVQPAVKCFKSYSFCMCTAIKTLFLTRLSNSHPTSNHQVVMLQFPKCLCELFTSLHSQSQHLIQAISPCCLSFVIFQCPSVTLFFVLSHYYPLSFQNTNLIMPFLCFNLQWLPISLW